MNIVEEFELDEENFVWQDLAMCVNIPTEAFFDDAEGNDSIAAAAKEICSYCPVREICLTKAQEEKSHGIRGGHELRRGKIID